MQCCLSKDKSDSNFVYIDHFILGGERGAWASCRPQAATPFQNTPVTQQRQATLARTSPSNSLILWSTRTLWSSVDLR